MAWQSPRLYAIILWAALLAGPTTFLGVALYLVLGVRDGAGLGVALPDAALLGGSATLSVATVAVSWLWAVRLPVSAKKGIPLGTGGAIPPGPEADAVTRLIVACALCEFGALAAVIAFLLTGSAIALAPYALSWIALAAHFPGERHWARLVGARRGTGAAPNRMIRE